MKLFLEHKENILRDISRGEQTIISFKQFFKQKWKYFFQFALHFHPSVARDQNIRHNSSGAPAK